MHARGAQNIIGRSAKARISCGSAWLVRRFVVYHCDILSCYFVRTAKHAEPAEIEATSPSRLSPRGSLWPDWPRRCSAKSCDPRGYSYHVGKLKIIPVMASKIGRTNCITVITYCLLDLLEGKKKPYQETLTSKDLAFCNECQAPTRAFSAQLRLMLSTSICQEIYSRGSLPRRRT